MVPKIIDMSHKTEIEEYPFEKKQKLADKISVLRDKPTLRKILDIIRTENPEATAKKDRDGYLMYFQNYTDETYIKIEKLLNKIDRDKLEQQTRSITEMSDNVMSSDDPNTNYTLSRTRLRYSNRERRLIKRQQYEDIINDKLLDSSCEPTTNVKSVTVKKNSSPDDDTSISKPNKKVNTKTTKKDLDIKSKVTATKKKPQSSPTIFSKVNNKR